MLDDRKSAILRSIVQRYIETAQAVGSTQLVESTGMNVSSATIRNEMVALEKDGYLVQPHTSAGRIPTEKAYRFFVDHLGGPGELDPNSARRVRDFFAHAHGEIEEMLADTSRLLSSITTSAAVVLSEPNDESTSICSVQVVGLAERSVLAVAVLSNGVVLKHHLDFTQPVTDDDLSTVSQHLARHLLGSKLGAMPVVAPLPDAGHQVVAEAAVEALTSAMDVEARRVYVDGTSRIAGAFGAVDKLEQVLSILEQQLVVVSLIRDVLDRGLTVAIGTETRVEPLAECALVVSPYRVDGEYAGTIGVLGPSRMNYAETMAAVALVSRRLGNTLSEG